MSARRRALLAAAVLLAGSAVVALAVVSGKTDGLDEWLSRLAAEHRVTPLTPFLSHFTDLGEWYLIGPIVIVTAVVLWRMGRRREGVFVAAATAVSWGLNHLLKAGFGRDTPVPPRAIDDPSLHAFPSGHSMTTTTFVTALALVVWAVARGSRPDGSPRLGRGPRLVVCTAAAGYAGLMGLSRVYLGVHWPTDVVAGWMLGAALALALWAVFVAPHEEAAEPAADTPVRVVLFDWGNTLMVDDGRPGPMLAWPQVAAVPGAAEALTALHGRFRLCVATNADDSGADDVMAALERVGLERYIDRVFSSHDLGARKPDPAFYAAVLDGLRADDAAGRTTSPSDETRRPEAILHPAQVVMVGDNYANDVAGAIVAGLKAVWFRRETAANGASSDDGGPPEDPPRVPTIADLRRLPEILRQGD